MPSRWFSLGIILFWLAVTGYLFWRDVLPRLVPDQPPPYTIELVEEARENRAYINWLVYKGNEMIARAKTRVEHPERDVFELVAQITPDKPAKPFPVNGILVSKLESTYRVNSAGNLLGLSVRVNGEIDPEHPQIQFLNTFLKIVPRLKLELAIDGEVEAGEMTPRLQGTIPGSPLVAKLLKFNLPTVSVPRGGAVLLPLHPVNRLRGLAPGQKWQMRVLDPLDDSLNTFQGKGNDVRILRASVRPQEEIFTHGKHKDVPCLVIDYEGDAMKPSTWVARKNGLVMCQEATLDKTHWAMYRD